MLMFATFPGFFMIGTNFELAPEVELLTDGRGGGAETTFGGVGGRSSEPGIKIGYENVQQDMLTSLIVLLDMV